VDTEGPAIVHDQHRCHRLAFAWNHRSGLSTSRDLIESWPPVLAWGAPPIVSHRHKGVALVASEKLMRGMSRQRLPVPTRKGSNRA
jgi:hypothetical protein